MSSKKKLLSQIEKIIDEGKGETRRVIIQMEMDDSIVRQMMSATSSTMRNRLMLTSARDVLPPPASDMKTSNAGKRSRVRLKNLQNHEFSMAAKVGLIQQKQTTKAQLRSVGNSNLKSLKASSFLKSSYANVVEKRRSNSREKNIALDSNFPTFWSSSSAAVELYKDDLHEIYDHVDGIADVFANSVVKVPTVVKAVPSSLPWSITENKSSAWGLDAISALASWGSFDSRGEGVKVCVLDTGVDSSHPDLAGKMDASDWAEFDGNGTPVSGSTPHDSGKHGTHCSGTVLGGNNSGKWIGVAPNAKLAHGLVLKNGSGTIAQILAGMQWAIDRGADVISMSLGGLRMDSEVIDTYTRQILTAHQLGIPVVAAIGNDGSQTTGAPGNDYFSFAVGATDSLDRAAGFSGGRTQIIYNSRYIPSQHLPLPYSKPDVSAPGVAVEPCIPGNKYDSWNGTSMATPHVAGAIALLLSSTDVKNLVPQNELAYLLQDFIAGSVEEIGETGKDHRYGFGRINVYRAIDMAKQRGY